VAPDDVDASARWWTDRLRGGLSDGDAKLEIAAYCGDRGARQALGMWESAQQWADSGWSADLPRWLSRFSVLTRHQAMHAVLAVVDHVLPLWEHQTDLARGFVLEASPPRRSVESHILTTAARQRWGLDIRHRLAVEAAHHWHDHPCDDHWSMWESATMSEFHLEDFVPRPSDDPPTVVIPACVRLCDGILLPQRCYELICAAMLAWARSDA